MSYDPKDPSQQQFPTADRDRFIPVAYSTSPPPRQSAASTIWTLLIVGGLACGCIISLAIAGGLVVYRNSIRETVALPKPATRLQLQKQGQEALNNFDIEADPTAGMGQEQIADYRSFDRFLKELEQASQNNDSAWLKNAVDEELLMQRIGEDGNLRNWDFLSRRIVRDHAATFEPDYTFHLTPIKLEKLQPHEDFFVAYAFGFDEGHHAQVEWRFWLHRRADTWKLIDWERLDLGLSQSAEYKIRVRFADTTAMKRFNEFIDRANESDRRVAAGNIDGAKASLIRAYPASAPPELKEYARLLLAYRWMALREWDDALDVADRIHPADHFPGVYSARATIYQELGMLDKALDNVVMYESVIGLSPQMSHMKAEILTALERKEEALIAYRAVLRQQKADPELFITMAEVANESIRTDLIPWLRRQPQPIEALAEVVRRGRYSSQAYELLSALHLFAGEQAPESATAAWLAGCVAEIDDDMEAAAEHFRRAMQLAPEANDNDFASDFLSAMVALEKAEEGYAAMTDKETAFTNLMWQHEDGEPNISDEQWHALVTRHRRQFPNDAEAANQWITQLLEQEKWQEAESEIQAALLQFTKSSVVDPEPAQLDDVDASSESPEDEEYYISHWQSQLLNSRARREPPVVVYESVRESGLKTKEDMSDVFQQLAAMLARNSKWSDLNSLIEKHKEHAPRDPWLLYYEGEIAATKEDWETAFSRLTSGRLLLSDDDNYLAYTFDSKIMKAACRSASWLDYYRSSEDKPKTFEAMANELDQQGSPRLSELIGEHQLQAINDPSFSIWMANHAWKKQDLQLFLEWSDRLFELSDTKRGWQIQQIRDNRRSALVMAQQYAEARAEFAEDPKSTLHVEALIAAAQGNHTEASALAIQFAEVARSANDLYGSPEFAWIWYRPEYRELQRNFPPRPLEFNKRPQFLALLREPMSLELDQVRRAAERAFGRQTTVAANPISDQMERSNLFTVHYGPENSQVWYVHQLELPRLPASFIQRLPAEYREALKTSGSCLLISRPPKLSGLYSTEEKLSNNELAPALRMLEDLGRSRIAAWYNTNELSLLLPEPSWAFQTSTKPHQIFLEHGQTSYLPAPEAPISQPQRLSLSRELRKHLLHEPTTRGIEVQARFQVGWLEERLWFAIENAERVGREVELRCKLLSNSNLAPNLGAGTICEIDLSEVIDWRWKSETAK